MYYSKISLRLRLFPSIILIFVLFSLSFVTFQYFREKDFRIKTLFLELSHYNDRISTLISSVNNINTTLNDNRYIHNIKCTIIDTAGVVLYDSDYFGKNIEFLDNHKNREEFKDAIAKGDSFVIRRNSKTNNQSYFYVASYYPNKQIIIRSAIPYNLSILRMLSSNINYIWFVLCFAIIMMIIYVTYTSRLAKSIVALKKFAQNIEQGNILDNTELRFPKDELGEISHYIVELYKRIQYSENDKARLKKQLTQNISHELKTPVSSIQGFLETILSNPNIDEATKTNFIQRSYKQTIRLSALLRDVAVLNKIDENALHVNFEYINIRQLITEIFEDVSLQLDQASMRAVNNITSDAIIYGDYTLLYSIFRNLTDNSIFYAGKGSTICVDAIKIDDVKYKFIFEDNGVGVDTEHLAHIFERFYRVDKGRSRRLGGTGLGLAIVKNAVTIHKGSIVALQAPNGGLRFEITLPCNAQCTLQS